MVSFKQRMAADEVCCVFSMGRVIHPVIIDMFALAGGYHGFWLDQEHGGLTYDQVLLASVCARANGFDCFVRMAPTDYALATQNLEAGAGGVLAARVDSAAQAEEFVTWCKFAPRGMRGMNTSGWDSRYTHKTQQQFAADANRDHLIGVQIETSGALDDVEKIAAIDGVDYLFLGPSDLSQSLGYLGQITHPVIWDAIDKISAACKRNKITWGTVPADPDFAAKVVDKGCRMLIIGGDIVCTKRGIEAVQGSYSQFFPK